MNSPGRSDYDAIRGEVKNELFDTTEEWGDVVFAHQYADPAHFLLELLQNAEDALARHVEEPTPEMRAVRFRLDDDELQFRHFGDPFNNADVRSICRIAHSTKSADSDLDTIGRFGLGFKSVYAVTDRPQIHSGSEDFAIVGYVKPEACDPLKGRKDDETVIVIPRVSAGSRTRRAPERRRDWDRLASGMEEMLSPANLLFLRHIESVQWTDARGNTATSRRGAEWIEQDIRRVTTAHAPAGRQSRPADHWMVFSRPVEVDGDRHARVEIAFRHDPEADTANRSGIEPISDSRLYAYFPTNEATDVGFLMQGPYNTTPARDNVRKHDDWNERLVTETAALLRDALRWLRDNGGITTEILRCLPLHRGHFEDPMYEPLFTETLDALRSEDLLPTYNGSHVPASRARLGRGQRLRRLFKADELGALHGVDEDIHWLRGDITVNSAPDLHEYLRREVGVKELDPEGMVKLLDDDFLSVRPDDWIRRLYEFLADQEGRSLRQVLHEKPILRLTDGSQVVPPREDDPGVFLPGSDETGFRTVRESVCDTEGARRFLESLGIREADPVDDVVENVLPAYREEDAEVETAQYAADIGRIAAAARTDSRDGRERLIGRLKSSFWIAAVDVAGETACWARPQEAYWPTPLLRGLFDGVEGVFFVDVDDFPESLRDLALECGVAGHLRAVRTGKSVWEQRALLEEHRVPLYRQTSLEDWTLEGLEEVLAVLAQLEEPERVKRSRRMWDALREWWRTEPRRSRDKACQATARWFYYTDRWTEFPAAFVRRLGSAAWVADSAGTLQTPGSVVFSSTGWKDEPGLHALLGFKDEEDVRREEMAGMLRLLEERGISSLEALRARLARYGPMDDDQDEEEEETEGGDLSEGEALLPEGTLPEVAEWWDETRDEERRKYARDAYPEGFRLDRLRTGARAEWFTMFALASFRSYGRTRDTQHRGFIDRAITHGWWNDLANSRPPESVEPWLEQLERWSDAEQTLQDQEFSMWRRSFVSLYTVARWLDEYTHLMRRLPDIVEEAEGRISLREVLDPTYSPSVKKLGVEAAPLARVVGMGINWMVRELVRSGFYERGGVMAPYSWMPSRRVRDFLQAQGLEIPDRNPDHSLGIHEFVCRELGPEMAEFHGDYDLPLQLWTDRSRGRQ